MAGVAVTSKTELLLTLKNEVVSLRAELEKEKQRTEKLQAAFKTNTQNQVVSAQNLRESIMKDVEDQRNALASQQNTSAEIQNWMKTKLGGNLEHMKTFVHEILDSGVDRLMSETKEREESLWKIFSLKFDSFKNQMEADYKQFEEDLWKRIRDQMEEKFAAEKRVVDELRSETLLAVQAERVLLEKRKSELDIAMKWLEDERSLINRERTLTETERMKIVEADKGRTNPDEEVKLFKKLIKKLEEERKAFEGERKKMEDERKRFTKKLEEERIQRDERRKLDEDRRRIVEERALVEEKSKTTASPTVVAVEAPKIQSPAVPITNNEVGRWLAKLGYETYYDRFVSNGYETLATVALLEGKDLESIGVTLPGHKKGLIAAAQELRATQLYSDHS